MITRINRYLLFILLFLLVTGCQGEKVIPPANENYFNFQTNLESSSGGKGTLDINFQLIEETNYNINLTYKLTKYGSDMMLPIEEKNLFHGFMAADMPKEFRLDIDNLNEGKYTIQLQALSEENEHGERWGALREIIFIVKEGKFTIEYESDVNE
ncbi:hypothetical protein DS745_04060 [Anaerobacillus alkaliphilus]|uniref:Uncharacterized protein n=1 Tax=Anaerobacillus alkaliphilus TaxID=1548597 RepID=A0A4Q0VXV1_9BACI|nr:hypothetical protein [Anaerobacillus alkaliphilus]RXJ04567.1 hypothetical protein DS745_04060 [Anaerobacillus alkaliphilus]